MKEESSPENLCPNCHFQVLTAYYFCPNCGKNLKPALLPVNLISQTKIYALSVLLPPLGLVPGIKYLMEKDAKAKTIGAVAITLTILSTLVNTWLLIGWVNKLNTEFTTQLNGFY